MIPLFKKTPRLNELIPEKHLDFHSHLLYGIDDGAQTPEDTSFLAREFETLGITQCIVTPHVIHDVWNNSSQNILSRLDQAQQLVKENGINLQIRAAAEYMIDSHFAKRIATEELLTLKDNYVLVELSYLNPPLNLREILFDMQVAGYIPVLAHPERYGFYHNSLKEFENLKNSGCLLQVNLLSAVGYYGEAVAKAADKLLGSGLIDFAGSDVHHKNHAASFGKKVIIKNHKALQNALQNNNLFRF